jgi:hypothetical protein
MGSATRHLIDQIVFARRADKMAARICTRLRRDGDLQDLGVRFLGPRDEIEWSERDGVEVYSTSIGGYVDVSKIVDRKAVAGRDVLGFHVEELEDKARDKGRWATLEEVAATRFKQVVLERLDGLVTALPSTPFPRDRRAAIRGHVRCGLWLGERDVRCWTDNDTPYVHVLMRVPFAALIDASGLTDVA